MNLKYQCQYANTGTKTKQPIWWNWKPWKGARTSSSKQFKQMSLWTLKNSLTNFQKNHLAFQTYAKPKICCYKCVNNFQSVNYAYSILKGLPTKGLKPQAWIHMGLHRHCLATPKNIPRQVVVKSLSIR